MRVSDTLLALWGMARPLQVLSVILVYGLGVLVARAMGYPLDAAGGWFGLLALIPVAASVHYANEYADFETDALTTPTPYSGGSGVLPRGLVPRRVALVAAWVMLLAGMLLALAGWGSGRLPDVALLLLVTGAFFGWMYSLPPLRLAWRGWGELDNALLGGLLLPLYGFAAVTATLDPLAALAFLPFAAVDFLNLLATTWPDRRADAQVGKRTLATRWPVPRLRRLYLAGGMAALTLLGVGWWAGALPAQVALVSLLVAPIVLYGWWRYTRTELPHAAVNAMTGLLLAQMLAWFGVA